MNARERYLAIMQFEKPDRQLNWELGYWAQTVRRWYDEGLPKVKGIPDVFDGKSVTGPGTASPEMDNPHDFDVYNYFNFDKGLTKIPVNNWFYPPFEEKILEDKGDVVIEQDFLGIKKLNRKDGMSMPEFIGWPVKNRSDWENLKERFIPKLKDRVPSNWDFLVEEYKTRDYPLTLGGMPFGYYGSLRYLFGFEKLCYMYYDNPKLIKDILRFLTDFWKELWSQFLSVVEVDEIYIWEDMCCVSGPLVSPDIFQEFMAPHYKEIIGFAKGYGIKIFMLDSDGDPRKLIPYFIDCGVTGVYPCEVASNVDIVELREQYPKLQLSGGLDKRMLAKGKAYIDEELKKIPIMFKNGAYIACCDHLVPPDVSWENFKYYRKKIESYLSAQEQV